MVKKFGVNVGVNDGVKVRCKVRGKVRGKIGWGKRNYLNWYWKVVIDDD